MLRILNRDFRYSNFIEISRYSVFRWSKKVFQAKKIHFQISNDSKSCSFLVKPIYVSHIINRALIILVTTNIAHSLLRVWKFFLNQILEDFCVMILGDAKFRFSASFWKSIFKAQLFKGKCFWKCRNFAQNEISKS